MRRLNREIALCLFLLTFVVMVMLYFSSRSLHHHSSETFGRTPKYHLHRNKVNTSEDDIRSLFLANPLELFAREKVPLLEYKSNSIYGKDGQMPYDFGELHSQDDITSLHLGYSRHSFNEFVSDRIGNDSRPIPDTRHELCRLQSYTDIHVQSSVIICFHKEALSTLLRTVATVIERTPSSLLSEVILVDDFSEDDDLLSGIRQEILIKYPFGKVRMVSLEERSGLIGARLRGSNEATGEVLIFLDSHCEVNIGWVEPLLQIVQDDNSTIACPIVDIINSDTFVYRPSPIMRGGFIWGLHFSWEQLPQEPENPSLPYISPTMPGGLFAVNRNYFFSMGTYDQGMKEWGGENLELSFRVWTCGGRIKFVPCSRVGHVFRRQRPNTIPGENNPLVNAIRVAEVWLDEYKEVFLDARTGARGLAFGDVSGRKSLRQQLQCKSFKWYLDTVYPEISIPNQRKGTNRGNYRKPSSEKVIREGFIKLIDFDLCLTGSDVKGAAVLILPCSRNNELQNWKYTEKGEIKVSDKYCIDASTMESIQMMKCDGNQGYQKWAFMSRKNHMQETPTFTGRLYSVSVGMCLRVGLEETKEDSTFVLQICSDPSIQQFSFTATVT